MNTEDVPKVRRCTVYRGDGRPAAQVEIPVSAEPPVPHTHTVANVVNVSEIMSDVLVCGRADLPLDVVVDLMMRYRLGCLPIVDDDRRPIGVITKFDLVELVHDAIRDQPNEKLPVARTAQEIMMPLALTLTERATVLQAAALIISEDTHHVLVVSASRALVGVISTRDIVAWLTENDDVGAERTRTGVNGATWMEDASTERS